MAPWTEEDADDLWEDLLSKHLQRLKRRQSSRLSKKTLQYTTFHQTIQDLDQSARRRTVSEHLLRLRPTLQHLDIFTRAIDQMVQTKSDPLGFIWGSIQAVLAVSRNFAIIWTTLTMSLCLVRTPIRLNP